MTQLGATSLQTGPGVAEKLALSLNAADYAISAGPAPAMVTLIAGGQDGEEVKSAAGSLGYEGDDVLSQKMDVTKPITVQIAQVQPKGDDIVLGSADADMALVDSKDDSLADDAEIVAVSDCLGDVVAAFITDIGTDDHLVAVGVRAIGKGVTSMLCVKTDDDAAAKDLEGKVKDDLASGDTANGKKYADYFEGSSVTVLSDGVVQAKLPHASDTKPSIMHQMLTQVDLPGF